MHVPPPSRMPGAVYCPVVWPKKEQPVQVIGLCSYYYGCWTHWTDRTVWCSDNKHCVLCQKELSRIWKGYMPCVERTTRDYCIVMFGQEIGCLIDKLRMAGESLRGRQITFIRNFKKKNAPVQMIPGELAGARLLPEAFDPIPSALFTLGLSWPEIERMVTYWKAQNEYYWDFKPKV